MASLIKQLLWIVPMLIIAAALEAGGDAGMRFGLKGKPVGFLFGAVSLIAYGIVVNVPKWDFGRLLGVYIAVFFIVSQAIAVVAFREKIGAPILVGGALIVAGGAVLTFWQPE
jgi:small multidrug resistance family-3 protein